MENTIQISNNKEEFFLNTINHFNLNNRSIKDGVCAYRGSNGNACAIGREIPDDIALKYENKHVGVFIHKLPPRLQKMGVDFLRHMQMLHDNRNNWNRGGLSEEGKNHANQIIIDHNLNLKIYQF